MVVLRVFLCALPKRNPLRNHTPIYDLLKCLRCRDLLISSPFRWQKRQNPLRIYTDAEKASPAELANRANATTIERMNTRGWFLVGVPAAVAVPLLYALSAGPLVYLKNTRVPVLTEERFAYLYHPLIQAEAKFPPLGHAMHWYIRYWETPSSDPDIAVP